MTKRLKYIAIFLAVGMFLSWIVLNILSYKGLKEFENRNFSGRLKSIKHGEKKFPYFLINDEWLEFGSYGYQIEEKLEIGDSIVKDTNSLTMKIFPHDGKRKYVEFTLKGY